MKFLRGAMGGLGDSGGTKAVKDVIACLASPSAPPSALHGALETLADLAEDLDHALGLMHLDAYTHVARLADEHVDSGVQWRALEVVAAAAQNNPQVQAHAPMARALTAAVRHMASSEHELVCVKAVGAVSSLARGNPLHTRAFFRAAGLPALLASLGRGPARVRAKCLHVLRCLMEEDASRHDGSHDHPDHAYEPALLSVHTAGAVLAALQAGDADDAVWEHALGVLARLPPAHMDAAQRTTLHGLLGRRGEVLARMSPSDNSGERAHLLLLLQAHQ